MARITDLLAAGRTFSFEFFPPKDAEEQQLLTRTIADLQPLRPSFVSVTYRGGRVSRERTTRVVVDLLRTTELTPMPHLTCVAHPRSELGDIISVFRAAGLENLLALGGDPLPAEEQYKELEYASQLVDLGRSLGFRSIGVAAELCRDLLDAGVPGLHFYTLNFSKATREIYASLGLVKSDGRPDVPEG